MLVMNWPILTLFHIGPVMHFPFHSPKSPMHMPKQPLFCQETIANSANHKAKFSGILAARVASQKINQLVNVTYSSAVYLF
jgi:hypothetical protein